jgi:hydroxymethylbilane synthase
MKSLHIATRKSPLALCQAALVKQALLKHFPALEIIFVLLTTTGDRILSQPLADIGGKGLFIKEIETALLTHQADIAVHSMKDMPVEITAGLEMAAYLEREDPRDVLVSLKYKKLADIPPGSKIGTASLRRQNMLRQFRQDWVIEVIRGNVDTRLSKLETQHYDAIILAAAGLHRLNLSHCIQQYFSIDESLPAIGQGIIGVQCREGDKAIQDLLQPLNHISTEVCVTAERAVSTALGGSCHAPIGGYAHIEQGKLHLQACVYATDGSVCLRTQKTGDLNAPSSLGIAVAADLLMKGADKILKNLQI